MTDIMKTTTNAGRRDVIFGLAAVAIIACTQTEAARLMTVGRADKNNAPRAFADSEIWLTNKECRRHFETLGQGYRPRLCERPAESGMTA